MANFSKEQIEQYREAVIAEIKKLPVTAGMNPPNYDAEIELVRRRDDDALAYAMQYNTPAEYAEMVTM